MDYYSIEWSVPACKHLKRMEVKTILAVLNDIDKIKENPFHHANSKALKGAYKDKYRLRIGNYRVVYKINKADKVVTILLIDTRQNVY